MGNLRGWKIRQPKLKAQLLKGRKDDGAPIARLFLLRREAEEFCNDDMQVMITKSIYIRRTVYNCLGFYLKLA